MRCISFQEGQLATRFPEISPAEWEKAIHLVDTNGHVYAGAEAVFRFRGESPKHRLLLRLYVYVRPFAFISEAVYRMVSHNRSFFSWICGNIRRTADTAEFFALYRANTLHLARMLRL